LNLIHGKKQYILLIQADLFGKLFDKPRMTERLLVKPPPKYIYEMIISTLAKTGFPKDLFSEDELNPTFFDADVKNKLEIFQKTIDITKIVNSDNFEIDAKKIGNFI
jgi:TRAF3-interacting protein 1